MKEDILNLIRTGEGHYLEFKERFNSSIGKDICAFANTFGGKIILGVKDNGEIKGNKITNSHKSEIQSISRNMDPPLEIEIREMDEVVIIEVPEGDKKTIFYQWAFLL